LSENAVKEGAGLDILHEALCIAEPSHRLIAAAAE
jgi:hypothetical protein